MPSVVVSVAKRFNETSDVTTTCKDVVFEMFIPRNQKCFSNFSSVAVNWSESGHSHMLNLIHKNIAFNVQTIFL